MLEKSAVEILLACVHAFPAQSLRLSEWQSIRSAWRNLFTARPGLGTPRHIEEVNALRENFIREVLDLPAILKGDIYQRRRMQLYVVES